MGCLGEAMAVVCVAAGFIRRSGVALHPSPTASSPGGAGSPSPAAFWAKGSAYLSASLHAGRVPAGHGRGPSLRTRLGSTHSSEIAHRGALWLVSVR